MSEQTEGAPVVPESTVMHDPIQEKIEEGKFNARQLIIIVVCALLNLSDGYDILAMASTAPRISAEFGIAADTMGVVFSAALAGMMIGAMFLAPISDVVGRRIVSLISVLTIAVSMTITAFVESLWVLVALRFLAGLGVGAILASLAAMASEYAPNRYKSLVVVCITLGYPLGAMFSGLIASVLIPAYGWPSMFLLGGAINFFLAVLVWFFLPESMHFLQHQAAPGALEKINHILKRIGRTPLSELPASPVETEADKGNIFANMMQLLGDEHRGKTLALWTTFFFCFSTLYFLLSWIPTLLIDAGFTEQDGFRGMTLFNLGAFFGVLVVGWLSTRMSLSRVLGTFLFSSGLLMVVYAYAPQNITLLLGVILLIGVLQQGGFTGLYAVAAKIYPTRIKATGIGWGIGLGRFGAVVGPAVAGVLIAAGISMQANFIIFAIPMLIGGFFAWRLGVR